MQEADGAHLDLVVLVISAHIRGRTAECGAPWPGSSWQSAGGWFGLLMLLPGCETITEGC